MPIFEATKERLGPSSSQSTATSRRRDSKDRMKVSPLKK